MKSYIMSNGVPMRIDAEYFRNHFNDKFSIFADKTMDSFIQDSIDAVYAMFNGVETLWDEQVSQVWFDKTRQCFGLLTAWYITDLYPEYSDAVASTGGMPVKAKSIGGVKIQYTDTDRSLASNVLESLKSNTFGCKAYMMIMGSVKRYKLFVRG